MSMERVFKEGELLSKCILHDLSEGELEWDDEVVQFFLPSAFFFIDFKWLEVAAEHLLIEEDCEIVKNFISKLESIIEINKDRLDEEVKKKLKGMR